MYYLSGYGSSSNRERLLCEIKVWFPYHAFWSYLTDPIPKFARSRLLGALWIFEIMYCHGIIVRSITILTYFASRALQCQELLLLLVPKLKLVVAKALMVNLWKWGFLLLPPILVHKLASTVLIYVVEVHTHRRRRLSRTGKVHWSLLIMQIRICNKVCTT